MWALALKKGLGWFVNFLGWCVKHPLQIGCILIGLYAWHLHGSRADERKAHAKAIAELNAKIAPLKLKISALESDLQTETTNAVSAELANKSNMETIGTLQQMLSDAEDLKATAVANGARALAQLQAARTSLTAAAQTEAKLREEIYAHDADAAAWRATPVPAAIADRLRASAVAR